MSEKTEKAKAALMNTAMGRRKFLQFGAGAGAAAALATPVNAQAPESWDREVDVVVVGAGYGGLPAAIEAKRAGSDVLVLCKDDFAGGLAVFSGGHAIVGATQVHRDAGVEDSPEKWYEDEMKGGDYRGVPEIVRAISTRGDEFLNWFSDLGIEWQLPQPSWSAPHIQSVNRSMYVKPTDKYPGGFPQSGGIAFVHVMLEELDRLGVPILLQHRMTRLIRPGYPAEKGPVVGVEVQTPQGTMNIKARRGVVLATGNALGNEQFCKAFEPRMVDEFPGAGDFYAEVWPYFELTADGHIAAAQVGATFTDMSYLSYMYLRFGTKKYANWSPTSKSDRTKWDDIPIGGSGLPIAGDGWKRMVLVKYDGKRYVNEHLATEAGQPEYYEQRAFSQAYMNLREHGKARNVWGILDAEGARELNWIEPMMAANPDVPPSIWPDAVAWADTIEDLAGKIGIPAEGLRAEIDRYNGFVDAGVDEDFGKPGPLSKIQTGPFYAARLIGNRHTSRNGLRINTRQQVLELADVWMRGPDDSVRSVDEEAVIPRLYAAAEVADPFGYRRHHGSIGPYVLMSITAGQQAAAETPA